jgi:hypothetical protein
VLGGFAIVSNGRAAWARLSGKRIPGGLFALSMLAAPEAAVVSVWLCVAAGLAELLTRAETVRAKAAAVILAALLPALHLPPLHATSAPIRTYGVDRLSADDVRRIVAGLPPDASLAAEDSNVAILRKTAPPASGSRLYALPWAQSMLMWRGFRLTDAAIDGVSGVAEAHRSSECVRVVRQWRDVTQEWFAGTTVMAFIRDQSAPEHDIVVYVASDAPFRPEVFGDLPTRPWLHVDTYAVAIESERERLDGQMREDRLASRVDAPPGPFAARLELWRSPDAPGLYPIQIGRTPTRVWVRAMANTDNDLVCASFPREVKDVEIDISN